MTHLMKIITAAILIGGMSSTANAGYTIDRYITCNDGYQAGWSSQLANSLSNAIEDCKANHKGYGKNGPFNYNPAYVGPKVGTLNPKVPHTPTDPGTSTGPGGPRPKGNITGSANPN